MDKVCGTELQKNAGDKTLLSKEVIKIKTANHDKYLNKKQNARKSLKKSKQILTKTNSSNLYDKKNRQKGGNSYLFINIYSYL